jgi:hypothetical protein
MGTHIVRRDISDSGRCDVGADLACVDRSTTASREAVRIVTQVTFDCFLRQG